MRVRLKPAADSRHLTGMKKTILGLALVAIASACSPLINPAVKQTEMQEQAQKQRKMQEQQPAPLEQTAQPATADGNRQP